MDTESSLKTENRSSAFRFSLRELLLTLALLTVVFTLTPYWHQQALIARFPYIDKPEVKSYDLNIGTDIYQTYTPLLAIFFSIALGALAYSVSRRSNKKSLGDGLGLAVPLLLLPYPLAPSFFLIAAGSVAVIAIVVALGLGLIQQRFWYAVCGTYNLLWLILLWSWFLDQLRAYGM